MSGLSAETGELMSAGEHLRQSIADILMTPIGTRVMRRDYGSYLPRLIDQPADPVRTLALMAAAADAIRRWEPRVILRRITLGPVQSELMRLRPDLGANHAGNRLAINEAKAGHFTLNIEAFLRDSTRPQAQPVRIGVDLTPRKS